MSLEIKENVNTLCIVIILLEATATRVVSAGLKCSKEKKNQEIVC